MPGATRDARCASTASAIDEVTQNRRPKVLHGPRDDVLGRRELELGARHLGQVAQLVGAWSLATSPPAYGRAAGELEVDHGHRPDPLRAVPAGRRTSR